MAYPTEINFDGVDREMVQQGAYWPGLRVRLTDPDDPEASQVSTDPLAQIRTKKFDEGGVLVATMRATLEADNWWHFDLQSSVTADMPSGVKFEYDVDLTDENDEVRTPIRGKIKVLGQVSVDE